MGNNNIFIHILGYVVVTAGLAVQDISVFDLGYWIVLVGVTIVYFNA